MSNTPENCSHDCGSCTANCSSRQNAGQQKMDKADFLEKLAPESSVKKVIGIVNGKGAIKTQPLNIPAQNPAAGRVKGHCPHIIAFRAKNQRKPFL